MSALDLVKLTPLMERSSGTPEILIGLIDGPVAMNHPDLMGEHLREIPPRGDGTFAQADKAAYLHGTFMAGVLSAKRNAPAPAICPNCTLLVRPIFTDTARGNGPLPSATSQELAAAIIDCINAGARIVNLSVGLAQPSSKRERELEDALDYAARQGTIAVVAAGNQGAIGSSAITRHPWVIPVVAYDLRGRPMNYSNFGSSIGRRGLGAPGEDITSLGAEGELLTWSGTSVAVPFVTGTIALVWSEFPAATATDVRLAVTQAYMPRRTTIVPPLLDAGAAYQAMMTTHAGR